MYRLTYQYEPEYENDIVQMAYCVPYSYTKLNYFLQRLAQNESKYFFRKKEIILKLPNYAHL